jgi:hypothetical protein
VVGLAGGDVAHHGDQPARRGDHPNVAVRQPGAGEPVGQFAFQLVAGGPGLGGRHLLGAHLEDQHPRHVLRCGRDGGCGRGGPGADPERVAQLVALGDPQPRHVTGQPAHPGELGRALGGGDRAARVQHVERLGTLQDVRVRRYRQARVDHPLCLAGVQLQ